MKDFRKLSVWQKAHLLTLAVYKTTTHFPKEELYGLTSQIRRACVSIPANIAEGCGKEGDTEFGRFLQIAQSSASELDYHLLLARELNFLNENDYDELSHQVEEVRRMLTTLTKRVRKN
jgi:four helix bundle protein